MTLSPCASGVVQTIGRPRSDGRPSSTFAMVINFEMIAPLERRRGPYASAVTGTPRLAAYTTGGRHELANETTHRKGNAFKSRHDL